MRIYKSAEDYLERILILENQIGNVRAIDIANDMKLTKQSIHRAIKTFKENGLIEVNTLNYITLTKKGRELAEEVYRRHLLLIDFLTTIGVSKEIALDDACKIEHDISEESLSKIAELLHTLKQK